MDLHPSNSSYVTISIHFLGNLTNHFNSLFVKIPMIRMLHAFCSCLLVNILFQVLQEIRKAWYKYALRRQESFAYSRSAFTTGWRKGSRHTHTMSSFIDRDRSSDLSNSSRLLPRGKNNNDCMSNSLTDLRSCNSDNVRRETCEDINCRFLTVPSDTRRNNSRFKWENQ